MLNYLIIGTGYIGQYLLQNLPNAKLLDGYIDNAETIKRICLKEFPSHVLINCAGKTGRPNIDWCEDNKDVTFGANVGLPVMIAETCAEIKQYWVHIGSGCIYDGYDKKFTEEDEPNYTGSFYSRTKIWSQRILEEYPEVAVLRIRMPICHYLTQRNYITKIVNYAKNGNPILSELNSMTVLSDLVEVVKCLTEKGHTGCWNVVNQGAMTADSILKHYKEILDSSLQWKVKPTEDVISGLKSGRSNCILSTDKLAKEGIVMPDLETQVIKILENYKKYLSQYFQKT